MDFPEEYTMQKRLGVVMRFAQDVFMAFSVEYIMLECMKTMKRGFA